MPTTTSDSSAEVASCSRRVSYRESGWRTHQFEVVAGGSVVCRVAALRMSGALLLWVGRESAPALGAVALGVPAMGESGAALSTPLTGAGLELETAQALARRLARALARPVHVCCGLPLDRFTAPLVERGVVAEIKSRPECF